MVLLGVYESMRTEHHVPVSAESPEAKARLEGDWLRHFRVLQSAQKQKSHTQRYYHDLMVRTHSLVESHSKFDAAAKEFDLACQRTGMTRQEILKVAEAHNLLDEKEFPYLQDHYQRFGLHSDDLY